jgi:hypothetical protein
MSPDVGRKTTPAIVEPLIAWLEYVLLTRLRAYKDSLLPGREARSRRGRSYDDATAEIQEAGNKITEDSERQDPLPIRLAIERTPYYEGDVEAIFCALLAVGALPGYELLAMSGRSTRYDGMFNFEAQEAAEDPTDESVPLGISETQWQAPARRDDTRRPRQYLQKWLEFKVKLSELFDDFNSEDGDPSKKYFEHISLAVVWRVDEEPPEGYEVVPLDSENWPRRRFFGATHQVYMGDAGHVLEVMEISQLVARPEIQALVPAG